MQCGGRQVAAPTGASVGGTIHPPELYSIHGMAMNHRRYIAWCRSTTQVLFVTFQCVAIKTLLNRTACAIQERFLHFKSFRRDTAYVLENVPKRQSWLSLWESWLGAAETERVLGRFLNDNVHLNHQRWPSPSELRSATSPRGRGKGAERHSRSAALQIQPVWTKRNHLSTCHPDRVKRAEGST